MSDTIRKDTASGFSTIRNLQDFASLWGWSVERDLEGQIILYTGTMADRDGKLSPLPEGGDPAYK